MMDSGGWRDYCEKGLDAEMTKKTAKADEKGVEEVKCLGDNCSEE